ncbi:MAG: methyltransferase domain-containing protein [Candidatus Limnocylindrales bacterium]
MTDQQKEHRVGTDFLQQDAIRGAVRETYRSVAPTDRQVADRFYHPRELVGLPDETVRIALGVGNPVRHADLRIGEDVLDLGSGGGIDSLIAARSVAPGGRVVGIDFLTEMVERATRAAADAALANVSFVESEMEGVPLPDASVDVVISNGVINLSPRKVRVLSEAFRVLRPGGRLAIVDLVLDRDLPPEIQTHPAAWAGCLSGALSETALYKGLRRAGFQDVRIEHVDDFGIAECALYPLFTDDLLGLLRRLVPVEHQHRIARSVFVRGRKPVPDESLPGHTRG